MITRTIALSAFLLASPANSQTVLERFVAKALKQRNGSTAPSLPARSVAAITPEQAAAIDRLLLQPVQDPRVAADRAEAAPLIRTLLATGACATASEAWNGVNRYMVKPQTFRGYLPMLVPMDRARYHDKARCMDVLRLGDWAKPAANALRFRAYYLAQDSGEAGRLGFELQKGSDGQWLVRDFGSHVGG